MLEAYEGVKQEVERHREFRKEEAARRRAEERLVPRDPTGEVVMEEVGSCRAVVGRRLCRLFRSWEGVGVAGGHVGGEDGEEWALDKWGVYPRIALQPPPPTVALYPLGSQDRSV